jgi:hypothetical protein
MRISILSWLYRPACTAGFATRKPATRVRRRRAGSLSRIPKSAVPISRRDIALMSSSRIWDEPEHQLPDLKGMVATAPDHLRCATSTPNVGWGHLTLTTASLTKFALILVPKTLRGVGVADLRRVQFS